MRKAFISPSKYVQSAGELLNLGYYIKTFGETALLIAHPDDIKRVEAQLKETEERFSVKIIRSHFNGECSRQEVARLKEVAKENKTDCVIGLGGGKALDTSKCVAEGDNLIVVPTIAATDAPTSHSAVLYTEDGAFDDYAYFKQNPSVVLVDTEIIAKAPTRFLVAGMGDALSTYFEARATAQSFSNVNAGLPNGYLTKEAPPAKNTIAAYSLAKVCYETLLENGYNAKIACDHNLVTPALENIVETNILLSGLGFESSGLAAVHAIHDGLTALEGTHHYYHGEKVAFSVICQLVLENAPTEELYEVLDFSLSIGLPVCLEDIGVENITLEEALLVAEKACIPEESIHSMPFPIDVMEVAQAIMAADKIGKDYKEKALG